MWVHTAHSSTSKCMLLYIYTCVPVMSWEYHIELVVRVFVVNCVLKHLYMWANCVVDRITIMAHFPPYRPPIHWKQIETKLNKSANVSHIQSGYKWIYVQLKCTNNSRIQKAKFLFMLVYSAVWNSDQMVLFMHHAKNKSIEIALREFHFIVFSSLSFKLIWRLSLSSAFLADTLPSPFSSYS